MGATPADLARVMAGNAALGAPTYATTIAVTVDARPEDIWPWLLQMGYRRGGLYSYDWLDRIFGYLDSPRWLFRVIEPAAFLMTRRMLLGLRRRAEGLANTR